MNRSFSLSRRKLIIAAGAFSLSSASGCSFGNEYDVIVVGGGGAGLAAAVSAAENNASVLLIEKNSYLGGNTIRSTGMYAAVDPIRQSKMGISDSIENYYQQMMESGRNKNDPKLALTLAENAYPTLQWLEGLGMRFQDELIETYGSHWPRDHRPLSPNGVGYIRTLSAKAHQLGVVFKFNARAAELRRSSIDDRINEIVVLEDNGKASVYRARKGIILASGGFAANPEMISRYAPQLQHLTHDNCSSVTGDMIIAAGKIGAALRDMSEVQCLPGCPPGRTRRVRIHVDVQRLIMINHDGNRFINEDGRRDDIRDAVLSLPQKYAFSLIDSKGMKSHDILVQKETLLGVESGDAWRADSLDELAEKIGVPSKNLKKTIDEFNHAVSTKKDPFNRRPASLVYTINTPPFWAGLAGMTIHCTMGGIAISDKAQVLSEQGSVIHGLFAAGETTGGVHGCNRLGAHGIPDAITFGRISGISASLA